MKLSRMQLKKILIEAIESDSIVEPQETIQSPIQDYIDKDTEKQDNVMQVEEKRYGLPFTNRDIRLLLLNYVDKIQKIAASKDYNTLSQINSRVLNYIDNLLLKINQGTAAIPAYSNEIDTQLSMFYYQSPNVLEDFKSFMLTQQDPATGIPVLQKLFKKIVFQVHGDNARYDSSEQAEQFKSIPANVVLKLANREGPFGFEIFAQQSEHIRKITSRIESSKTAIKEFQKFAEHAAKAEELGEDVGYMGTDLIEDFLSALSNYFRGAESIDERRFPNVIKAQNLAENELYDAMESGDLRKAYRLTRKLMRIIHKTKLARNDFYAENLLDSLQKILDYTDKFRFGPEKHLPKLVRSIRASMEGFQTLFENNKRNKMKLTKRKLRNLITEALGASELKHFMTYNSNTFV